MIWLSFYLLFNPFSIHSDWPRAEFRSGFLRARMILRYILCGTMVEHTTHASRRNPSPWRRLLPEYRARSILSHCSQYPPFLPHAIITAGSTFFFTEQGNPLYYALNPPLVISNPQSPLCAILDFKVCMYVCWEFRIENSALISFKLSSLSSVFWHGTVSPRKN